MADRRRREKLSRRNPNLRKIRIWLLAALIGLFTSVTYCSIKANRRGIIPYSYARWGMTLEQCQEVVDLLHAKSKVVLEEEQKIICTVADYEGRKNIDALVSFICRENGLEEMEVYIINRKEAAYTRQKLVHEYVNSLDTLCGKHTKDSVVYTWFRDRTQIQLIDYPNKPVCIRYKWINKG